MEEKGGETKNENKKISTNYINSKIIIYAIVVVIFGGCILVAMVFLGMNIANRQSVIEPPVDDGDNVTVLENIEVEYDETQGCYIPLEERAGFYTNSLMHQYGIDNQGYAIIRSSSELKDFVNIVNMNRATEDGQFVYDVGDDFFKTGVVIAVAREDFGLASMDISHVYRNEYYSLQVYYDYKLSDDRTTKNGKFSLLQIQNIQPKTIDLKQDYGSSSSVTPIGPNVKKPIIYLYPTETTFVDVKLSNPERITTDYPNYNNGWKVVAHPDGTLKTKSNKQLYALYYESQNIKKYTNESLSEGFVVSRDKVEEFLDEKLDILGLNYKEREEFISYWIGELESKPYVFIRFQKKEEIENNMGLHINPRPDTIIRIMMEYKKLDNVINVKAQSLEAAKRKGFTVVEWGGTEIKL